MCGRSDEKRESIVLPTVSAPPVYNAELHQRMISSSCSDRERGSSETGFKRCIEMKEGIYLCEACIHNDYRGND